MSSLETIVLKSSDGMKYQVTREVAMKSKTIKRFMEVDTYGSVIPLPNTNGDILEKVIFYWTRREQAYIYSQIESPNDVDESMKLWDSRFVDVHDTTLFRLLLAASYLNVEDLIDLTCHAVLDVISEMIRKNIGGVNQYDDA